MFRLISDVHNEFFTSENHYNLPVIDNEKDMILIIAGDFTSLSLAKEAAPAITSYGKRFKHVLYIPGNHEYYKTRIDEPTNRRQFDNMNPEGLENIHFMIRDSITIDGTKFIGCTLWTNINNNCPVTQFHLDGRMSDFRVITYYDKVRDNYSRFRPVHWLLEHAKDIAFLKKEVENSEVDDIVVITHHAPSFRSQDDRYLDDQMSNHGYMNNLDLFVMDNPQIRYWVHGHIHKKLDYMINTTNVLCNPHGYSFHGEVTGFVDGDTYEL